MIPSFQVLDVKHEGLMDKFAVLVFIIIIFAMFTFSTNSRLSPTQNFQGQAVVKTPLFSYAVGCGYETTGLCME